MNKALYIEIEHMTMNAFHLAKSKSKKKPGRKNISSFRLHPEDVQETHTSLESTESNILSHIKDKEDLLNQLKDSKNLLSGKRIIGTDEEQFSGLLSAYRDSLSPNKKRNSHKKILEIMKPKMSRIGVNAQAKSPKSPTKSPSRVTFLKMMKSYISKNPSLNLAEFLKRKKAEKTDSAKFIAEMVEKCSSPRTTNTKPRRNYRSRLQYP